MSTYDRITARILQALTHGIVPWHQPWQEGIPRNLVSGRPYRGINIWLTVSAGFGSAYWLTFNQAHALGGSIQKGAKGTPVVFWKGSDVHVMLALRRSSREVVVADEELNGTDMVRELLGKR